MRRRVCGAVLKNDSILMVYHQHQGGYWTLPGGAIEPGETEQEAAVREMREETGLRTKVARFLFEETYDGPNICRCYLLIIEDEQEISLGIDPEESHLEASARMLQGIAWLPLSEMKEDVQVAQVLKALQEI